MNNIEQTIKRILMESHIPPPIYLRRRFSEDELNKIFRDSVDYVLQSEGYKHLALKRKKEVVAAYMMDDLHPVLSNSGTQDFNYDEIFNYLVHYYSPKIEKVLNLNEQVDNSAKIKLKKIIDNQGLLDVIRALGLEKVSKILQLEPIDIAREYFENKVYSIHDFGVRTGSYDFRFKITDIIRNEGDDDTWYVYVKIVNGTVDIDGDETYDLWDSDLWEQDWWWEIQNEIGDILFDILFIVKGGNAEIEIVHNLK
jgi:hypothetical protein